MYLWKVLLNLPVQFYLEIATSRNTIAAIRRNRRIAFCDLWIGKANAVRMAS